MPVYRLTLSFDPPDAVDVPPGGWRVRKCKSVNSDWADRVVKVTCKRRTQKRLHLLSVYAVETGRSADPLNVLNFYLMSIPGEEKMRRVAEMRAAERMAA